MSERVSARKREREREGERERDAAACRNRTRADRDTALQGEQGGVCARARVPMCVRVRGWGVGWGVGVAGW